MLEEKIRKDQDRDILAKWLAGIPAATIAAHIGNGVTRSAVIGRVRTMKKQGLISSDNRLKSIKAKAEANSKMIERSFPEDFCVHPAYRVRSIALLADDQCRWPLGDPQSADFHFCCGRRGRSFGRLTEAIPYCPNHMDRRKSKQE